MSFTKQHREMIEEVLFSPTVLLKVDFTNLATIDIDPKFIWTPEHQFLLDMLLSRQKSGNDIRIGAMFDTKPLYIPHFKGAISSRKYKKVTNYKISHGVFMLIDLIAKPFSEFCKEYGVDVQGNSEHGKLYQYLLK